MTTYLLVMLFAMAIPATAGIILIIASRGRGLGYPACAACKYNLKATIGSATRCPECGADFAAVGILAPKGTRKPLLLWTGVVILLFPLTCVGLGVVATMSAQRNYTRARQAATAARQAALASQPQTAPAQQGGSVDSDSLATTAPAAR